VPAAQRRMPSPWDPTGRGQQRDDPDLGVGVAQLGGDPQPRDRDHGPHRHAPDPPLPHLAQGGRHRAESELMARASAGAFRPLDPSTGSLNGLPTPLACPAKN
jgi:hypothetical protein